MSVYGAAFGVAMGFAVLGWFAYLIERQRSRDYATDLAQLVHDYDLNRDDLRRSLGHDEIEDQLDRK
jgi:hypothetical protein